MEAITSLDATPSPTRDLDTVHVKLERLCRLRPRAVSVMDEIVSGLLGQIETQEARQ
ncbi:MAG: hypothetical protein ABI051_03290 [Vicinamibacterales bacterium]